MSGPVIIAALFAVELFGESSKVDRVHFRATAMKQTVRSHMMSSMPTQSFPTPTARCSSLF